MKTIGIITYHHYNNYGTMLQAMALQKKVELFGYDAEIIDYKKVDNMSARDTFIMRLRRIPTYITEWKKYYVLMINKRNETKRIEAFEDFYLKNLRVSKKKYCTIEQLELDIPRYDGYIVGSDQTWNPYVSGRPEAFYLPFVDDEHKKGSYAPSLAVSSLNMEQANFLKKRLCSFSYLSCREETGAKLLTNLLGKEVYSVIDPTLLLNNKEWDEYASDKYANKKYMLVYLLGEKLSHRIIINKLSEKLGLNVICLPISFRELSNRNYDREFVGPEDFLALIKNATFICTDSFHGAMFSINYSKQFFAFCKNDDEVSSENSRLIDSLKMLGLESRILEDFPDKIDVIDYDKVRVKLAQRRTLSESYLKDMLADITR